jgi:hypothetical protein
MRRELVWREPQKYQQPEPLLAEKTDREAKDGVEMERRLQREQ